MPKVRMGHAEMYGKGFNFHSDAHHSVPGLQVYAV